MPQIFFNRCVTANFSMKLTSIHVLHSPTKQLNFRGFMKC